ncbi:hypothetical protein [Desulfonatronum sp. SC1]|uniref:hypothetical protein n=1 Tax=Desulfonatronum sp. SC1 TaxID=2109626 RepID=UPI001304943F|nr:hypothetical protein [Desulfonatronum sp. SC1]
MAKLSGQEHLARVALKEITDPDTLEKYVLEHATEGKPFDHSTRYKAIGSRNLHPNRCN